MAKRVSKKRRSKKNLDEQAVAVKDSTTVWGPKAEDKDWLKLPRALLRIGRHDPQLAKQLKPRHYLLLLYLASRRFKDREIRAHWARIGEDLGVPKDTVRKWGYELVELGLLVINEHRKRDPEHAGKLGYRNDSNGFDLSRLVDLVEELVEAREKDPARRKVAEEEPT